MTRFDRYLHAIMTRAAIEAGDDGSTTIEAGHLLLAIAREREPTTRELLDSAGLDATAIRDALDREFEHSLHAVGVSRTTYALPPPSRLPTRPSLGASAKLVLERGVAAVPRKKDVRPAHLLLGVLRAEVGTVPRALALAGVDRADLLARVEQALAA